MATTREAPARPTPGGVTYLPGGYIVRPSAPRPMPPRTAGVHFADGVDKPPALLIRSLGDPMRAVARTWLLVGQQVPVTITSWWRDARRNRAAGGAEWSQHRAGTAMDGLSPGLTRAQLLPIVQRAAARTGATVPTAASEGSGRSVHVQGLPVGAVERMARNRPDLFG